MLWKFPMFSQHCHPLESSLSGLREGLTQDRTLRPQRGAIARSCPGPLAPSQGVSAWKPLTDPQRT